MADYSTGPRLIAFDMDGTLIADRFIFCLAHRFDFKAEIVWTISRDIPEYDKTKNIASMLKGIRVEEITNVFDRIPLSTGARQMTAELKEKGHLLAIISDSYTIATERLKERLGFDFTVANNLVVEDGKATGEVEMPLNWIENRTECLKHSVCKLNALLSLSRETGIPMARTVAIGDNTADICMLKQAGLGIAFSPKAQAVALSADITIDEDLSPVPTIIKERELPPPTDDEDDGGEAGGK